MYFFFLLRCCDKEVHKERHIHTFLIAVCNAVGCINATLQLFFGQRLSWVVLGNQKMKVISIYFSNIDANILALFFNPLPVLLLHGLPSAV